MDLLTLITRTPIGGTVTLVGPVPIRLFFDVLQEGRMIRVVEHNEETNASN